MNLTILSSIGGQYKKFSAKRIEIEKLTTEARELARRKKTIDLSGVEEEVREAVEIELKYEGYIRSQNEHAEKFKQLEKFRIPSSFDYDVIKSLSNEVRAKLKDVRPATLAQASNISGITPAAISILMVYLK